MADVAIDDWLAPVIEQVATFVEIQERRGVIDTDNPQITIAARQAYSMIRTFCGREFHKKTRVDYYPKACGKLKLRHYPVVSVASIYSGTNLDELISSSYYTLHYNQIWFTGYLWPYIAGDFDNVEFPAVITYEAGTDLAEDTILNALVLQTTAQYQRKKMAGLTTLNVGGKFGQGIETSGDAGSLLDAVVEMISKFEYTGDARDWN